MKDLLWTDIDPETGKTYLEIYREGQQAGYNHAMSLGRPFKSSDWPEGFVHRGGVYWRGYAEGVLSAGGKLTVGGTK